MSMRFLCVLMLAAICGTSAAVGMSRMKGASERPLSTVPVLVAKTEIASGTTLSADMLEIRDWPEQMAPRNVISKLEDVVGCAAIMQFVAGDLVLSSKIADKGAGGGLAPLIPDGMRAYTIQTSRIATTVAGFVLPGNRVDVLLTLKGNQSDDSGGGSSTTLLQAVKILAVDQRLESSAESKSGDSRSVTLLVSPRQAAFLDLGQNLGQLTLSLRNPLDVSNGETQPATLADLRIHQEGPAAEGTDQTLAKTDSTMFVIRTLRGTHGGQVSVSKGK